MAHQRTHPKNAPVPGPEGRCPIDPRELLEAPTAEPSTTNGKHHPGSLNSTDHTFANAALIAQFARTAGAGRVALGASCINIKNRPLFSRCREGGFGRFMYQYQELTPFLTLFH